MLFLVSVCVHFVACYSTDNDVMKMWVKTSGFQTDQCFLKQRNTEAVQRCLTKDGSGRDTCFEEADIRVGPLSFTSSMITTLIPEATAASFRDDDCKCSFKNLLFSSHNETVFRYPNDARGIFTPDIKRQRFVSTPNLERPFYDPDWWIVDSSHCHFIALTTSTRNHASDITMHCLDTAKLILKIAHASSKLYLSHYDKKWNHLYYFQKTTTWQLIGVNVYTSQSKVIAQKISFVPGHRYLIGEMETRMIVWCSSKRDVSTKLELEFSYVTYSLLQMVHPRVLTKITANGEINIALVDGVLFWSDGDLKVVRNFTTGRSELLKECPSAERSLKQIGAFGNALYMACMDSDNNGHFRVVAVNGTSISAFPIHAEWDLAKIG